MSKDKKPLIIDGINVSKCYYVIDYDPPEWQGTWGGAIHKGLVEFTVWIYMNL